MYFHVLYEGARRKYEGAGRNSLNVHMLFVTGNTSIVFI